MDAVSSIGWQRGIQSLVPSDSPAKEDPAVRRLGAGAIRGRDGRAGALDGWIPHGGRRHGVGRSGSVGGGCTAVRWGRGKAEAVLYLGKTGRGIVGLARANGR